MSDDRNDVKVKLPGDIPEPVRDRLEARAADILRDPEKRRQLAQGAAVASAVQRGLEAETIGEKLRATVDLFAALGGTRVVEVDDVDDVDDGAEGKR